MFFCLSLWAEDGIPGDKAQKAKSPSSRSSLTLEAAKMDMANHNISSAFARLQKVIALSCSTEKQKKEAEALLCSLKNLPEKIKADKKSVFYLQEINKCIEKGEFYRVFLILRLALKDPLIEKSPFIKLGDKYNTRFQKAVADVQQAQINKFKKAKYLQFSLILFLIIAGVFWGSCFKRQINFSFVCFSGFSVGLVLWLVSSLFLLSFGIPFTLETVIAVILILTLTVFFFFLKKMRFGIFDVLIFIIVMSAYGVLLKYLLEHNYVILSGDSWGMITAGKAIAYDGELNREYSHPPYKISNTGVSCLLLQAISVFVGSDYIYIIYPLLVFSLLTGLIYFSFEGGKTLSVSLLWRISVPLVAVYALLRCKLILDHIYYIHTNMLSANYLLYFIGATWLGLSRKNYLLLAFSMFFILGFTLSRVEGPLYALLFLVLMFGYGEVPYKIKICCIIPYLAFMILWTIKSFMILPETENVDVLLTPKKLVLFMAPLITYCFIVIFSFNRKISSLLQYLPQLMMYLFLFASIITLLIKPQLMCENFSAIILNMTLKGNWGAIWRVILPLFILALFLPRFKYENFLLNGILSYFFLLYLLGFMRPFPYYARVSDSANRMLIHIIPIVLFYLFLKFGANTKILMIGGITNWFKTKLVKYIKTLRIYS